MMFACRVFCVSFLAASAIFAVPALAGKPKLDKDTCTQLRAEQVTFIQSGILADLQRGADWGKSNLSADRLREVEHYITLDEQIKFACREATLTPELEKVGEIAKRLELNPNLDPFAPLPDPVTTPEAATKPSVTTAPNAPSGLSPTPDTNPIVRKQKSAPEPKAKAKTSDARNADDALKAPPVYIAPPPISP